MGWCVFRLFFKIDLCSTTSMESSRRDLLNDMAEHKSILKNNQNSRQTCVQPYHSKDLGEGFPLMWLNIQYRSKVWTHFFSFFKTAVEIGPVG